MAQRVRGRAKRVLAATALLLGASLLVGGTYEPPREAKPLPLSISLVRLIANPLEFDGKNLRTFGFVKLLPESRMLFLSKLDAENDVLANGITLDLAETVDPAGLGSIDGTYVLAEGRFAANRPGGPLNPSAGVLFSVTTLEPLRR